MAELVDRWSRYDTTDKASCTAQALAYPSPRTFQHYRIMALNLNKMGTIFLAIYAMEWFSLSEHMWSTHSVSLLCVHLLRHFIHTMPLSAKPPLFRFKNSQSRTVLLDWKVWCKKKSHGHFIRSTTWLSIKIPVNNLNMLFDQSRTVLHDYKTWHEGQ